MLKYILALHTLLSARLRDDERGATMVEYGLMVALVAVFCIVAVTAMGGSVSARFTEIADAINPA